MPENADQNNSEYGHFLLCDYLTKTDVSPTDQIMIVLNVSVIG